MFDTYVTVCGNVLSAPQWRRTANTHALVTHFKVASTARRWDRESGQWVDGDSLRVRVSCWRRLAEGVASSVMVGDPVVVFGRLFTRDWTDADGVQRSTYELEAATVGHDLSRGRGTFARNRPAGATSEDHDLGLSPSAASETGTPELALATSRPAAPTLTGSASGWDPRADQSSSATPHAVLPDLPTHDELDDDFR